MSILLHVLLIAWVIRSGERLWSRTLAPGDPALAPGGGGGGSGGSRVSYITLPQVDHGMIAEKSAAAAVNWMDNRFKGAHPASNCGK